MKNTSNCKPSQRINIGNLISTNNKDIANEFNRFYVNVGPTLDANIPVIDKSPLSYLSGNYPRSMAVPFLTTDDTLKAIKSLKDKNDRFLPTHLIKSNAHLFAFPLTKIFVALFARLKIFVPLGGNI